MENELAEAPIHWLVIRGMGKVRKTCFSRENLGKREKRWGLLFIYSGTQSDLYAESVCKKWLLSGSTHFWIKF